MDGPKQTLRWRLHPVNPVIFFAILAAAAPQPARAADGNGTQSQQKLPFQYLTLARHWPPSLCRLGTCSQPTFNLFTIHGLFPTLRNGSLLASCPSNITFAKNMLWPQLRGKMSCEWRNFKGANDQLWAFQWETFGSCALPLFTNLTAYFRFGVALHEQFDINEALVKGGINPLLTQRITPPQLGGILEQQWNVTPTVVCSEGAVLEVRTCFSTAFKPVDCPVPSVGCPSTAQEMPFGSTTIPEPCKAYVDGVPSGRNPASISPPPPPRRRQAPPGSGGARAAPPAAASAALLLAAAAGAAALVGLL